MPERRPWRQWHTESEREVARRALALNKARLHGELCAPCFDCSLVKCDTRCAGGSCRCDHHGELTPKDGD